MNSSLASTINYFMQQKPNASQDHTVSRRQFIAGTSAAAVAFTIAKPQLVRGAEANSKINIGLIGCGGRGQWIADLFVKNGSYNIVALADYFQDRVDEAGTRFNVPAAQRFTGLSGYKKLLEQKLDAVVVESPPYFHPAQAADAVSAGKHVYCAKPVAVDVPGCLTIEESGKRATEKKLCFLVDFQTRANASFQEAVRRVKGGMIGKLVSGEATYLCGPTFTAISAVLRKDPKNSETQLRAWGLNRILSGDVITEQNIHALDVACWIIGANPIKAVGSGGEARGLGGTCWDHFSITYSFPNDLLVSFSSKQYGHGWDDICCRMYGVKGTVDTHYFGAVSVKSDEDGYNGGRMNNLYAEGAINNIATFADSIRKGDHSNPTVVESVRSNLTTILGRTAAYKGTEVTWAEMMRKKERWDFDVKKLKA